VSPSPVGDRSCQRDPIAASVGVMADVRRWTFLEKGIDSVMLKLEEGVDMKTVCCSVLLSWLPHQVLSSWMVC
jgi:hypothetical protein